MVFPDMQAVLGLDALAGYARSHHFREAVDVHRMDVERLFDLGAHGVRPGFRPEDADLERRLARVEALLLELVENRQHVGRRDHDHVRLKIVDELNLSLGHAARHGDHRATEALGAVMGAQPAGEEAIAIGHMRLHAGATAAGPNGAGDHIGPVFDVALRVADDCRLAGGSRGGMNAGDLVLRHGEHAEWIVVPQVGLGGERKLGEVAQILEIVRVDARRIELCPIMRHVLIGMAQGPGEALALQSGELLP